MKKVAYSAVLTATVPLLAACPGGTHNSADQPRPSPRTTKQASHGPFFPECGGVSDQTVAQLTGTAGLVLTARNSLGCQWLVNGSISGPWFSFSWFRGSPIGRERKNEDLTRTSVDNITIDGHSGFVAVATDRLGARLCDVAIQFQDDFFEWSIQFNRKPFPNPCDIATELARQSIAAAK
ncbi:DUF3558 domain-containing protein [Mycobacterium vicinigordonae]|uniref:DUF3558 domain-containing protein n=1 Tax=Mycobacterium vicinigordonae TaxID=1719132 RepID=A0A7D6HQK4_9MYCO|nr:DUF3558 domain-containing protein [Mycobacterium vicinigordonae]QLL07691.1 DUF3558 domain-containing protein [Mycobacterium vicinigordonae]